MIIKTLKKTDKQIQPIVNEQAINSIKNYINKHKTNTYLFEDEFGNPLTETQIVTKPHRSTSLLNMAFLKIPGDDTLHVNFG